MSAEKPFYRSKKFWYAVAGVAVTILSHFLGLSIEESAFVAGIASMLVGGQAAADFGKHGKEVEKAAREREAILALMHKFIQIGGKPLELESFSPEFAKKVRGFVDELQGIYNEDNDNKEEM